MIKQEAHKNYLKRLKMGHLGRDEEDRKNLEECDWLRAELDLRNKGKVRMV